jgi:hypothetical protein
LLAETLTLHAQRGKLAGEVSPMPTLSEQAEHYLRQEFALLLAVPHSRLEKAALLEDLFPESDRRRIWREGAQRTGLRFPALRLSPTAQRFVWWTVLGNAARVAAVCVVVGAQQLALPLAIVVVVVGSWLFYELSRPWAVWIKDMATFDDLVRWIVARNMGKLRRRFGAQKLTRDEIFEVVKVILVDSLGVRPEQVTWDATFAELGCD